MVLEAQRGNASGGDLFVLFYEAKTGKLHGLNSSGWSPTGVTTAFLASKGIKEMPLRGIYSVTVPGAVEGWDQLRRRFGRRSLAEILAPAIRCAARGFPVTEIVASPR